MESKANPFSKGERTRQRIIDCSVSTISRMGFEGVVLSEIAMAAGVTRASIIQYFGNRERLIEETIRHLGESGRSSTLEYMSTKNELGSIIERYVRATFNWARNRKEEATLLCFLMARAGYDQRSKLHVDLIFSRARKTLATWIAEDPPQNLPKANLESEIEALSFRLHTTLLGFFVLIPVDYKRIDYYEEQCLEAIRRQVLVLV